MANPFFAKHSSRPYLTLLYAAACLIVTVPTIFWPDLYSVFGGPPQQHHPWLLFTAAFQHGYAGIPPLVHLLVSLGFLFLLGPILERVLGTWRYGLLILTAIVVYSLALYLSTLQANGATGVIWAFGPPLFVVMREARHLYGTSVRNNSTYQLIGNVLILMYVVITIFMTAIPYLGGFRGNLLYGFVFGNLFHFTATVVGVLFAVMYRHRIRERLLRVSLEPALTADESVGADALSIGIGIAVDALLLTVLLLALF